MSPSTPRRLKDTDVAETTARLRAIMLLLGPMSVVTIIVLALTGNLGAHAIWLVPIVLCLCALLGYAIYASADRFAHGFMRTLIAGGGEARTHDFSEQDALVMQGRESDAIASYEAHLAQAPHDIDAHLRLAALLARDATRADRAASCFLAARELRPSPCQDAVLSNGLIDLYRATDNRERLKYELARFARLHERSVEGQRAHEYLRRLVAEEQSAE